MMREMPGLDLLPKVILSTEDLKTFEETGRLLIEGNLTNRTL